ncbi:protein of unknown function [Taphrina deformans PYCC 5710]|uniref:Magnesium transporter n=1 Tax=Taphrina deformans (strain PYCC 5710 / ATCC 11124 / CBS 356.35 / IMI 108563 / JCM 9778 / NBRC 8474) TaxID=1097556 RepID=R4XIJ1_TAPDE|nr:protein of unknown function [Taphrina deformans PYCC 5710]|eukprot:CCG84319.1 protein of unknown function [Taphrina deformans PYCC 5710]
MRRTCLGATRYKLSPSLSQLRQYARAPTKLPIKPPPPPKRRYKLNGDSYSFIRGPEDAMLERSLSKSISPDLQVRCTEFDAQGNVRVNSGQFKKTELCTKHGLLPRDLRKVDTGVHTIIPSILVRSNSILVNLLHIRALVKADLVLVFDVYGSTDSHTQSVFMYDLEGRLQQGSKGMGGLPYEFRALESILISVVTSLGEEMKVLKNMVEVLLAELEQDIHRDKLQSLLVYNKRLNTFLRKATLIRDHLDEFLEEDKDISAMYLTEKLDGVERPEDQHDEAELLLESYLKQTDEIVQVVETLVSDIDNTEGFINLILDAHRNNLMLFELRVTIATLAVGSGTLVAGLYGMNLKNFLEESQYGFFGVTGAAFIFTVIVLGVFRRKLRVMQKLTLNSSKASQRAMRG